ncbi:MAG: hypothetical protein HC875_15340 [Anaerolineales bacterium]|nr:hypothetical protein [Anaerolineales bacterium]
MNRKIKVLMIGDSILAPSGVGHVCKNIVDALLKSGKFQVHFLAGAIKHDDYRPIRFQEYGEDLTLYPVDEYSNQDIIRGMIRAHRPDMLFSLLTLGFIIGFGQLKTKSALYYQFYITTSGTIILTQNITKFYTNLLITFTPFRN